MNKLQGFTREYGTYGDIYTYGQTIMGHTLQVSINLSPDEDIDYMDDNPKSLLALVLHPQKETLEVLETSFYSTDEVPALLDECVEEFRQAVFS